MNTITNQQQKANTTASSAETRYAGIKVNVLAFKPFAKNTLCGFADLELPAMGLKIIGATLHQKADSRWVGLPGRPYQDGGEQKWAAILDFTSKAARDAFQIAALAALDAHEVADGANG